MFVTKMRDFARIGEKIKQKTSGDQSEYIDVISESHMEADFASICDFLVFKINPWLYQGSGKRAERTIKRAS